jgi:hypothetical protein
MVTSHGAVKSVGGCAERPNQEGRQLAERSVITDWSLPIETQNSFAKCTSAELRSQISCGVFDPEAPSAVDFLTSVARLAIETAASFEFACSRLPQ